MDYCSSCRRHLNGALVCPGCGAYAPDIAPSAAGGPAASAGPGPAAGATTAWGSPPVDTWYDGYFRDETAPAEPDPTASSDPAGDMDGAEAASVAPQGRAARRRQRARWKKNQRRAVVATAVALMGGGLAVASVDRGSGDKAQAATAPERPETELPEQQHTELTRPASTPPDTRETPRTDAPSSKPSPTSVARESVDTPRTTRQFTRPDAATPSATATTVPQTQTVAPPSGGNPGDSGGSSAGQQTPAPTPTDGADSGASQAPSDPAPEETTPAQLCVLNLLCVG
ncbi:SCO2400 family protein [Streptomyces sp. bgisy027]|uniref:SCO2400 family protein n=1 Tax=Streptomyces sp. bgisy027 TaxID=3413770 RepID=UPI003D748A87